MEAEPLVKAICEPKLVYAPPLIDTWNCTLPVGTLEMPEGAATDAETVTELPSVIGLAGVNDEALTLAVPLFTVRVPETAPVVPEL